MIQISPIHAQLSPEMRERLACTWGSARMVTRGRLHDMGALSGFVATDELTGRLAGIALMRQERNESELVVLEAVFERRGVGSRLLETVTQHCRAQGIRRLWLVTTNDNTNAIRFYQKRGFELCAFHHNGIAAARALKPEIPATGYDGIPIRHELEFQMLFQP